MSTKINPSDMRKGDIVRECKYRDMYIVLTKGKQPLIHRLFKGELIGNRERLQLQRSWIDCTGGFFVGYKHEVIEWELVERKAK